MILSPFWKAFSFLFVYGDRKIRTKNIHNAYSYKTSEYSKSEKFKLKHVRVMYRLKQEFLLKFSYPDVFGTDELFFENRLLTSPFFVG